jgi:hypothetical protein
VSEQLASIARRIETAFSTRKLEDASVKIPSPIQRAIQKMQIGELPDRFQEVIHESLRYTHHTIKWLLTGDGDKRFKPIAETKEEHKIADTFLKDFEKQLHKDVIRELAMQMKRQQIAKQNELKNLIREIIREEITGSPNLTKKIEGVVLAMMSNIKEDELQKIPQFKKVG